jgi:hypothetical protein
MNGKCDGEVGAMSHAGWVDIWNLAVARFGAEAIEGRILIGLAVAFTALMIVEGLRACFLPRRHEADEPVRPKAVARQASAAPVPFRPRSEVVVRHPKREKAAAKPHRAERPKIRRMVSSPKSQAWVRPNALFADDPS